MAHFPTSLRLDRQDPVISAIELNNSGQDVHASHGPRTAMQDNWKQTHNPAGTAVYVISVGHLKRGTGLTKGETLQHRQLFLIWKHPKGDGSAARGNWYRHLRVPPSNCLLFWGLFAVELVLN